MQKLKVDGWFSHALEKTAALTVVKRWHCLFDQTVLSVCSNLI